MATVVEGGRDPSGAVTPRPRAPVSGPELASTPLVIRRREDEETVVTFPYLVWREFLAGLAAFVFLMLVSIQVNAPLLQRANTSITPNPAKAPWYFVGLQELLERFPPIMAGRRVPELRDHLHDPDAVPRPQPEPPPAGPQGRDRALHDLCVPRGGIRGHR